MRSVPINSTALRVSSRGPHSGIPPAAAEAPVSAVVVPQTSVEAGDRACVAVAPVSAEVEVPAPLEVVEAASRAAAVERPEEVDSGAVSFPESPPASMLCHHLFLAATCPRIP